MAAILAPLWAFVGLFLFPRLALARIEEAGESAGWMQSLDAGFASVNEVLETILFYPLPFLGGTQVPLAVALLVTAGLTFSVWMGLPQISGFRHAIDCVRGVFDNPKDAGEVSSFQALTSALSATVGLGNIGGVAIAIYSGGPGAAFWMVCAGVLGMASKFTEVSLALMYRETRPDGRVMGGAMFYLSKGLGEMGKGKLGKALSVAFAVACIGGSFGGGNTVQVSQSLGAVRQTLPFLAEHSWVYGLVMAVAVGSVIIGGIQRIAQVAEKIVPLMCGIYLLATMTILGMNAAKVPDAFMMILTEAFSPKAVAGGMMGVLVIGFRRAAFSNEAGVGSSAIAHSAARTPYAIREGIVALLEPFIDTVIVCTMTALMIVVTGAYNNPAYDALGSANDGAAMTSAAMGAELSFFPLVLSGIVILFAFSTMISWSYYGERCWAYLFGDNSSTSYRILFCVFTFLGSVVSATNILNLGDLMIFSMAFPNLLGVFLLAPKVRKEFTIYLAKLRAGEFKRYK